ncbi:MAG TPA: hypothetical protein VFY90_11560, partial [Tepidiformaceae bacterium]|nr:hypothetical protein [Tepidiformaceae bacterium]
MVSGAGTSSDGAVTRGLRLRESVARICDARRRYGAWSLARGLLLRRHFSRCGVLAWRGGLPTPHIENRGTLVAENISLFSGVRLEVEHGATLSIGKGTYLNRGVTVVCDREVRIGRNCA